MTALETIAVAFAMFSAIPCPQPVWTEKNMRYALCAFPLVGAVCGLLLWGWTALAGWLPLPGVLAAAGQCLLPVLVTGASTWMATPTPATPWQAVPRRKRSGRSSRTPGAGPSR